MEADEVYSELNDKITELTSKDSEFQGTIDYLQSSITELKNTVETMKTDVEFAKSNLDRLQGSVEDVAQKQLIDSIKDNMAKLQSDMVAAQKKADDQAGLATKLTNQLMDMASTVTDIPNTAKVIAQKAWDDGKKEILATWEDGKKVIVNSLSDYTTGKIKEAKDELWTQTVSYLSDGLLTIEKKPKPITVDEFEGKVKDVLTNQKVVMDSDLEGRVKDIVATLQAENTDAFSQKINDLITAYATTQGWPMKA